MNEEELLKQFYKTLSEYKKTGLIKDCFYHDKSQCKGAIKQSHSIQRNGRLSIIESEVNGNQSIYTFTSTVPSNTTVMGNLKPIGKKEASTFFGFCDFHDSYLFSRIENHPFDQSDEHCFLHSYRSYAHSYHRKMEESKAYDTDSIFTKTLGSLRVKKMREGVQMAINESRLRKNYLDEKISIKDYSSLSYLVYQKEGLYPFAVSSQISPMASYTNKPMNNHLNPDEPFSQLMLTFLPDVNSTIVILAAFPDDEKALNLLDELEILTNRDLEKAITSLILANCENTFFSPKFWNTLSSKAKRTLLDEFDTATNDPIYQTKFFRSQFNFFDERYEISNLQV